MADHTVIPGEDLSTRLRVRVLRLWRTAVPFISWVNSGSLCNLSCPLCGVKVITDSASKVQRLCPAQGKCPTRDASFCWWRWGQSPHTYCPEAPPLPCRLALKTHLSCISRWRCHKGPVLEWSSCHPPKWQAIDHKGKSRSLYPGVRRKEETEPFMWKLPTSVIHHLSQHSWGPRPRVMEPHW